MKLLRASTPPAIHIFAPDSAQAAAELFPSYAASMSRIGRERGWPPLTRQGFEAGRTRRGALFVGSPQQVAEKILAQHELFAHDRFLAHLGMGGMPHDQTLRAIELLGTEVAPLVRAELGAAGAAAAAGAERA